MNTTEKRARELSEAVRRLSQGYTPKPVEKKPRLKPFSYNYESLKTKNGAPGNPGKDGSPGAPGKDAVIDMEAITKEVIDRIRKEKSLLISDLKDGQSFVFNKTKYQTHEMMHGAGASETTVTFTNNEVVAGSGTSWTLAATPTAGSVILFGNGQFLTPGGVDYTISSAAITTVNSFSAGTIVANYRT